jgi:hypothetical protein
VQQERSVFNLTHQRQDKEGNAQFGCVCVFRTFTSSFGQIICWAKKSSYLPAEQPLWPHDIAYYKRACLVLKMVVVSSQQQHHIHPPIKGLKDFAHKCSSYTYYPTYTFECEICFTCVNNSWWIHKPEP